MKLPLYWFLLLSLLAFPLQPFSQNTTSNTSIASVEYLQERTPIQKKIKKKKRKKKFQRKFKKTTKLQTTNSKKGIPTFFLIMAGILLLALIAWSIYFFPLLASGALSASWGCLAPIGILFFGFIGILFSAILIAGIVLFTFFAIRMINRKNRPAPTPNTKESTAQEEDYIQAQIKDKASKDLPYLAPKSLEKYTNIKRNIVELKYKRSQLEAKQTNSALKNRIQREITDLNEKIARKEALVNAIEALHSDLEKMPEHKKEPYTNIKLKIAKLQFDKKKYQEREDYRAIQKQKDIDEAIQEQEEELKLLLGIGNN